MKESVTYQAILAEGHGVGLAEGLAEGSLREAKSLLMRMGRQKFGKIDASSQASFEAIKDLQRVESLAERFLEAKSWPEFLATPRTRRSSRKGKR